MSVYTVVSPAELEAWLQRYAVGTLVELVPITAGIENTNYFVTTTRGAWVLTLYERLPAEDLPFYLNLMAHLAEAGVPCPPPVADRTGAWFGMLNGKPAGLVGRVGGQPVTAPDRVHCAAVGEALARLHRASATYAGRLANRRGPLWWRQAARAVRSRLTGEQADLLAAELKFQSGFGRIRMPRGAIHGDLFRDNVLFTDSRIEGIIDFGFAATDFFAYDLAIAANDWCLASDGDTAALSPGLVAALVDAYQSVRPLSDVEQEQWPSLLRAAALRFWLSRLHDLHVPRAGEILVAKDPAHFERILRHRIEHPARLPWNPTSPR